jgi:hypothetical protein
VDINKLSNPEKIIGASAIVLLIASFLPWFKVSFPGGSVSGNGWDVGFLWGRLPVLIALVMLAHIVISNFFETVKLPDLPWPMVHLVGGILVAALVVLKMISGEHGIDRAFGLFLAVIAAIGVGAGGFLYWQEKNAAGPSA